MASSTDARNGPTLYTYNAADQVQTLTTPAPGTGQAPQLTTTFYDTLGRQTGQLLPDGTATTNQYFQTGLLRKTWGARAYPVEDAYDPQGRLQTLTTWQNFGGGTGAALATWT